MYFCKERRKISESYYNEITREIALECKKEISGKIKIISEIFLYLYKI